MNLYLTTCLLAITISHAIFLVASTDWVEFAKVVTPTVATIVVGILAYLEARAAKQEAKATKLETQSTAKSLTEKVDANTRITEDTGVAVNGRLEKLLAEARAAAFAEGKLQGLSEARTEVRAEAREDRPTVVVVSPEKSE